MPDKVEKMIACHLSTAILHYNFLPLSFMLSFLRIVFKVLVVNDQTRHIFHDDIMKNTFVLIWLNISLPSSESSYKE